MTDKINMAKLRFDDIDFNLYKEQKIQVNKGVNRIVSTARKNAKRKTCFLCKRECSSFCQSHSIPQFCLRRIADNGKVIQSGLQEEFPILGDDTGVKKAGTFYLICNECDNTCFQEYEDPTAYQETPTPKILAQIAMKNALHSISVKREELELYRLTQGMSSEWMGDMAEQQINLLPLDINQYSEAFRYAKVAAEKNKTDRFKVAFYQKLPYTVPIAFQASIAMVCDFEGNIINNIYNVSPRYKLQDIDVAVFPLEDASVVLAFVDCRNKRYDGFIGQLHRLTIEEQLAAINYIIFSYSENVFISKKLKPTVLRDRSFLNVCQRSTIAVSMEPGLDPLKAAIREFDLSKRSEIPNLLSKQFAI